MLPGLRGRSMLSVAINGNKLFDWEEEEGAVARIEEEMGRLAAHGNVTKQALAQSLLLHVVSTGRPLEGADPQIQMIMLAWLVLETPTQHPDHPGRVRDYVGVWNFDCDIRSVPDNPKRFTVKLRANFDKEGVS